MIIPATPSILRWVIYFKSDVEGGMTQRVNFPCSLSFLAQVPCSLFFFLASSLFPFLFPGRVPSSLKNVILFPNYFGQCSQFPQFFGSIFPVPLTLSSLPVKPALSLRGLLNERDYCDIFS